VNFDPDVFLIIFKTATNILQYCYFLVLEEDGFGEKAFFHSFVAEDEGVGGDGFEGGILYLNQSYQTSCFLVF
jgi:hypothetical protein